MRSLLLIALLLSSVLCFAEDKPAGGAPADMQAQMQQYMALIAPGPQHKMLADGTGEYTVTVKMWMDPAGEPTVSQGKSTAYMIGDGRYLVEDMETTMMGMPFKGRSTVGYDNFRKEYWSTWVDNMSTGIMISHGQYDEATKTLTMNGTSDDPMTGKRDIPFKTTVKKNADGTSTFEMFGQDPTGKEVKMMEMVYTKVK